MGAAAEKRADRAHRAVLSAEQDRQRDVEMLARYAEVAQQCDTFVQEAMSYIVEPRGLRAPTIEANKARRGYEKRQQAVIAAHNRWVGTDFRNPQEHHQNSVRRAQAVYGLLMFLIGKAWTIPSCINVPRAAIP